VLKLKLRVVAGMSGLSVSIVRKLDGYRREKHEGKVIRVYAILAEVISKVSGIGIGKVALSKLTAIGLFLARTILELPNKVMSESTF